MIADARGRAAYLAYRAGADLARVTPPAIGSLLAGGISRVMTVAWPTRRSQVARNLQRVTGGALQGTELEHAVNETFGFYGRYWHEFFRLQDATPEWIMEHCDIEGYELVKDALEGGRGAILGLPHLGHWDFAGASMAARGIPLCVVTEAVEPPELFEWFVQSRRRLGMEVIPLGPSTAADVSRALGSNQAVCLLCDRDLTGAGVAVEFFGESTTVPGGPALLALRTGAALLPCAAYFTADGGHVGKVMEPIPAVRQGRLRADVERVTTELVRRMEDLIRDAPEQWLMMQPNWPSDRAATRGSGECNDSRDLDDLGVRS